MLVMDDARWEQLVALNWKVNTDIEYVTPNPWQRVQLGQNAVGDCKTYATTKFDLLYEAGWPLDSLFIAECNVPVDPPVTFRNHAVLIIDCDKGMYVCSNGIDKPTPIKDLAAQGWKSFIIQVHGSEQFRELLL